MLRPGQRRAILAAVAAVGPLVAAPGPATAATPVTAPVAPRAGAAALLLTRADLGTGWSVADPAPRRVPPVACGQLHLHLRGGAAHPAAAASPTYAQNGTGVFFAETVYRYATAAQARQVWRRVARRALLACLARGVVAGSTRSVQFTVTRRSVLRPARVRGASTAEFRIVASADEGGGQSVDAYLDTFVLRAGSAMAAVSFSSVAAPPPAGLKRRLAGGAVRRLDEKTR